MSASVVEKRAKRPKRKEDVDFILTVAWVSCVLTEEDFIGMLVDRVKVS